MTNAEIIEKNAAALMNAGIIKGSGNFTKAIIIDANGNETEQVIEIPEAIHTFAAWKQLGYVVKRGQKAKACFQIWKYKAGKEPDENAENESDKVGTPSHMFLTKAFFFTFEQVEKLA